MFFDTHAHYDSTAFNSDRAELLPQINSGGVDLIINPGCDIPSSRTAVELSQTYDFIYAAVGIHPEEMDKLCDNWQAELYELAGAEKTVAIGEIGLDYYWDAEHKSQQKELFIRQIEMALELNLPVIIHDREAHGDSMDIVRQFPQLRGVFHCYSGSVEMARELIKMGFYLGFDGPITYKNAKKQLEVLEICPIERILIETDSPYMTPVPNRGKRNDSRNLLYIAQKLGELKGISTQEAAQITKENGKLLFEIGD